MRKTQLTPQELAKINADYLRKIRDRGYGRLINYGSGPSYVTMVWDWNKNASKNMMFKLDIDGKEIILDWEDVQKFGRWI